MYITLCYCIKTIYMHINFIYMQFILADRFIQAQAQAY